MNTYLQTWPHVPYDFNIFPFSRVFGQFDHQHFRLIQHDRIYICWFFDPSNLPNINCVLLLKFKRVRTFLLSICWLQLWISRQRQPAISDWITLSSEAWSDTKECARNGKWKYVRMTSFQLLFVINNVCIKITPMVFAAI